MIDWGVRLAIESLRVLTGWRPGISTGTYRASRGFYIYNFPILAAEIRMKCVLILNHSFVVHLFADREKTWQFIFANSVSLVALYRPPLRLASTCCVDGVKWS